MIKRIALVAMLLAGGLTVVGCGKKTAEDELNKTMDSLGKSLDSVMNSANKQLDSAMNAANKALDTAAKASQEAMKQADSAVKTATGADTTKHADTAAKH